MPTNPYEPPQTTDGFQLSHGVWTDRPLGTLDQPCPAKPDTTELVNALKMSGVVLGTIVLTLQDWPHEN